MLRKLAMLGIGLLIAGPSAWTLAQEGDQSAGGACEKCALIKAGQMDYCDAHGKGSVLGMEVTSKKLYEALAPVKHTREELQSCPGCRKAAESKSKCETCGKMLIGLREYKSPMAFTLAKGREVPNEMALQCEGCKKAWAENGSCTTCNMHYAGKRMFENQDDQKAALAAVDTIKLAIAAPCEGCAVAMVTDGTCEQCKASYKDGKKVGA